MRDNPYSRYVFPALTSHMAILPPTPATSVLSEIAASEIAASEIAAIQSAGASPYICTKYRPTLKLHSLIELMPSLLDTDTARNPMGSTAKQETTLPGPRDGSGRHFPDAIVRSKTSGVSLPTASSPSSKHERAVTRVSFEKRRNFLDVVVLSRFHTRTAPSRLPVAKRPPGIDTIDVTLLVCPCRLEVWTLWEGITGLVEAGMEAEAGEELPPIVRSRDGNRAVGDGEAESGDETGCGNSAGRLVQLETAERCRLLGQLPPLPV